MYSYFSTYPPNEKYSYIFSNYHYGDYKESHNACPWCGWKKEESTKNPPSAHFCRGWVLFIFTFFECVFKFSYSLILFFLLGSFLFLLRCLLLFFLFEFSFRRLKLV